ncbi:hypothetical protein C8Q78DRAFT_811423 [Trametes maxima]|nr:hypothetical protein C8Q78DRAFT_811423 [Trametes maxima]
MLRRSPSAMVSRQGRHAGPPSLVEKRYMPSEAPANWTIVAGVVASAAGLATEGAVPGTSARAGIRCLELSASVKRAFPRQQHPYAACAHPPTPMRRWALKSRKSLQTVSMSALEHSAFAASPDRNPRRPHSPGPPPMSKLDTPAQHVVVATPAITGAGLYSGHFLGAVLRKKYCAYDHSWGLEIRTSREDCLECTPPRPRRCGQWRLSFVGLHRLRRTPGSFGFLDWLNHCPETRCSTCGDSPRGQR